MDLTKPQMRLIIRFLEERIKEQGICMSELADKYSQAPDGTTRMKYVRHRQIAEYLALVIRWINEEGLSQSPDQ